MNGRVYKLIFILIIFVISVSLLSKKRFSYIGAGVCEVCHSDESTLNQYVIWLSSPHAKAVKTLKSEKAMTIAGKLSIVNPVNSIKCLKCHTTGKGRVESLKSEGVGCEACHGPGSEYSSFGNHVNYRNRVNGYIKAKKHGMYPILDYEDNLLKREKMCLHCHKKNRPCMPTTVKDIQKQKITIQVIDKLRKGDVNFSHPIRKY